MKGLDNLARKFLYYPDRLPLDMPPGRVNTSEHTALKKIP